MHSRASLRSLSPALTSLAWFYASACSDMHSSMLCVRASCRAIARVSSTYTVRQRTGSPATGLNTAPSATYVWLKSLFCQHAMAYLTMVRLALAAQVVRRRLHGGAHCALLCGVGAATQRSVHQQLHALQSAHSSGQQPVLQRAARLASEA